MLAAVDARGTQDSISSLGYRLTTRLTLVPVVYTSLPGAADSIYILPPNL
jgi:hypothetical protein